MTFTAEPTGTEAAAGSTVIGGGVGPCPGTPGAALAAGAGPGEAGGEGEGV
ncbi:MAG: hypothetical protein WBD57_14480 [Candidatus Cybelea sp.]